MANRLHVLPLSGLEMGLGLANLANEVSPDVPTSCDVSTFPGIFGITLKDLPGNAIKSNATFREFEDNLATCPAVPCTSATLKCDSTNEKYSLTYHDDENGTYFRVENFANRDAAVRVMRSLHSHFKLTTREAVLGASLPERDRAAIQFKEEAAAQLGSHIARLGIFLTQMAEKNAEAVRMLTTDLEQRYHARQAQLESRIKEEQDILDQAKKSFDEEKKAFNDRQRTHVRRNLLDKIIENINARQGFQLTLPGKETSTAGNAELAPQPSETNAPSTKHDAKRLVPSRLLIHIVCVSLLLISAVGAVWAAIEIYRAAGLVTFDWRVVPPFSFAALLFAGTMIFYLKWTSRWADRIAYDERAVSQYASDILRASWIAELLFEYKDEKQKEIPPEVIASLTEGLFKREGFREANYHPSDDIAQFLKRLKVIRAGPQGWEVSADGKK